MSTPSTRDELLTRKGPMVLVDVETLVVYQKAAAQCGVSIETVAREGQPYLDAEGNAATVPLDSSLILIVKPADGLSEFWSWVHRVRTKSGEE
jgi:hypothetical protein